MRARRPAAVVVLALLVTLLVPLTTHQSGTPSTRLTAAVQDALPAARPASRHPAESALLLDGLAPAPAWRAPDQPAPLRAAAPALLPRTATGAVLARGPPQG